jgi:predicted enzyme related to lactoylglutathione lyase
MNHHVWKSQVISLRGGKDMLKDASITTILPVIDMARARDFYENKLELPPQGVSPDEMFLYSCGSGSIIGLLQREGGTKAEHTALSFEVENIEATIDGLEARGVVFEDYDLPGLKTANHIFVSEAEKCAWFNDTEGNILCIHEVLSSN